MNPFHWLRRRPTETARRRVLYFLHTHHEESHHTTQLAQRLDLADITVRAVLFDLEEQGWVMSLPNHRVALTGHGFFAAHNELYGTTQ